MLSSESIRPAMTAKRQQLAERVNRIYSRRQINHLAVRCAEIVAKSDEEQLKNQDKIRLNAQARYQKTVDEFIEKAKVDALLKKRKKREEMIALFLLLMLGISATTYGKTYEELVKMEDATKMPTEKQLDSEAKVYAVGRQKYLKKFPESVLDRIDREIEESADLKESDDKLTSRMEMTANKIKEGQGTVVAETESQATYGSAQIHILRRAGFKSKSWITMDDERVRESHNLCEMQGAIPIDVSFHNGLKFPGDPNGGPEEVCNCRCYLIGGTRLL